MKRSFAFSVLLLAGVGCAGIAGMQSSVSPHSGKRDAYEAVLRSSALVAEAKTCNPPTGYEVYCGGFGRVRKSGVFEGLVVETMSCPEAAPCRVTGTITVPVGGLYTTVAFAGRLSRSNSVYMRELTFSVSWRPERPAASRVNYTVSFVPSMRWDGYMKTWWQRSVGVGSGWTGLIRMQSSDPDNIDHWREHFP